MAILLEVLTKELLINELDKLEIQEPEREKSGLIHQCRSRLMTQNKSVDREPFLADDLNLDHISWFEKE